MKVGVEIGGTFTDVIVLHDNGDIQTSKVLSTPNEPQIGAMKALKELGFLNEVDVLIHASTVATNALIQRRTARAGLITTAGFGDILEIQRHDRSDIFNPLYKKPEPVIPRDRVAEIVERLDPDGKVIQPLDRKSVETSVRRLIEEKNVNAIAVCLLFSYRNPVHEEAVYDIITHLYPTCEVLLSCRDLPQIREYERASTMAIAAALAPILTSYVSAMSMDLDREGFCGQFHIMQSNGGILPASQIKAHSAYALNSGPAAGVTGALDVVKRAGLRNAITLDMGGTSADVCLIFEDRAELSFETKIGGLPVQLPMIDVVSIGAGGGSIAWVDEGAMLRVGPQSAGATPGPACYGLGGTDPTVTDANVALGLIRKAKFFDGKMALDLDAARVALERLSPFLEGDYLAVADTIRKVVNSNMLQAIRLVSVERGFDPRDFYLVAFGGAGPLHAAQLAAELGMRGTLVPRYPGLMSAYGLIVADFKKSYVRTISSRLSDLRQDDMAREFHALVATAQEEFARQMDIKSDRLMLSYALDMRYTGQAFELTVPVPEEWWLKGELEKIREAFIRAHEQRYGYAMTDRSIDVVNVRLTARAEAGSLARSFDELSQESVRGDVRRDMDSIYSSGQRIECLFIDREAIQPNSDVPGPAIIEEPSSTTFVPMHWRARIDEFGDLWIEKVGF